MIEFLLGLVALVVFGFGAMWIYCAIFDFVDEWKKKDRLRREKARTLADEIFKQARDNTRSALVGLCPVEARLPPMAPAGRYGIGHKPPDGGEWD